MVQSLDARTGAEQWSYGYPTSYRDDFGFDEGPRAVPVVANGIVYTFGAEGQLHAVALTTGTRLWSEDTARRFKVAKGFFGAAGSPLVEDGRVIANVGGKGAGIVAFDAKTGKVLWTATDDEASYSSGVAATIAGKRYAIFLTRAGLVGLDPATGAVQFQTAVARTAERVGQRRDADRAGRPDFHLGRVRTGCGCVAARGDDADGVVELRMTRCRTTTRRACCTTVSCSASMDARSSAPVFARWSSRPAAFDGVRIGSWPAASSWPAIDCSSCAKTGN